MKTVKCGIIGCGVIAPSHIESFKFLENVEVKWACDLVPAKARKMAEQYGIPHTATDYLEVLNDPEVDCIAVCTDHGSHAQIAADAMDHKKHVICEKSLGRSHECLEKMLAAHKRNPKLAFGGVFQHRHEPVNQVLKELIDSGAFGTITTVSMNSNCLRTNEYYLADAWRGTWAHEGGAVLINQAIHYIDLINWLLGGIAEISARCENMTHQGIIETEDNAAFAIKFKRGMLGAVTASASSAANWRHSFSISGTEGYLEYLNLKVTYLEFNDKAKQQEIEQRFASCNIDPALQSGKVYYGGGHPAQIKDFVQAIREKRQPFITGESAAETVKVVLACYESSRTGKWVKP
ncbi:MAG: Gfo/Idh/MocA family protein [Victivallaceae bacterium]